MKSQLNMKKEIQPKSKMQRLEALLKQTTESLVEAGRLIVEMVREDPANYDLIKSKFGLSDSVMERFQNIGLGRVSPRLALSTKATASLLEKLPLDIQNKVLDSGVSVVRSIDGGKIQSETVPFDDLSYPEAQQALGRSIEEQAARLKEKLIVLPPKPTYETFPKGGPVEMVVFHDARFTVAQLEDLVSRLRSDQITGLEQTLKSKQVAG